MKRNVLVVALIIAVGVVWRFPLFHIVRLGKTSSVNAGEKFIPAEFAESFWNERLLPSLGQSADADIVLAALREDPKQAGQQFGRSIGVSRSRLICVRGAGNIVSVDKQGVGVSLAGPGGSPEVVLLTGLLFGNTVRDVSGLLDAGEFSNSRHYNDVSTELNRIVESQVIGKLKETAEVGNAIEFIACGQLSPDHGTAFPLRLIPLKVEQDVASTRARDINSGLSD
jgi:predicted lipoprotein